MSGNPELRNTDLPAGTLAAGTALLRGVAESLFLIRKALEHGNVPGAREAARRLVTHLDALPEDRAEYERLCEAADRELAADPEHWAHAHPKKAE